MTRWSLLGLRVAGDLVPPQADPDPDEDAGTEVDLTVMDCGSPVPDDPGEVLSAVRTVNADVVLADAGSHLMLTVPQLGFGFRLWRTEPRIDVHAEPWADRDAMLAFLGSNAVLAWLWDRGELVLHASAVLGVGGCVAFTGGRGTGKSTLAALLGRAGLPVVADDLIRVALGGSTAEVRGGNGTVRLRPGAARLLGCLPAAVDPSGRALMRFAAPPGPWPLRAVLLLDPVPTGPVVLRTVGGTDAVRLLLARNPLGGWSPQLLASAFDRYAALAASVEVGVLQVPHDEEPECWVPELVAALEQPAAHRAQL